MDELYDYLNRIGLSGGEIQIQKKIYSLDLKELIPLANNASFLLSKASSLKIKKHSFFNFSVSSSLSGVSFCCTSTACRLERINKLSMFASMYADTVVIPKFLRPLPEDLKIRNRQQESNLYETVANDFLAFINLKSLIDEGIIIVNSEGSGCCDNCAKEHFREIIDGLKIKLKNEVSFILENRHTLLIKQKKHYSDIKFFTFPQDWGEKLKIGKFPYNFSDKEAQNLQIFEKFFAPIVNDVIGQKNYLQKFNLSYLTNREVDADIIGLKNGKKEQEVNKAILSGLSHVIPYIEGANIEKILEIRRKDGSAFVSYRDAFGTLIKQTSNIQDEKKIKEAVRDIVLPEVNKVKRLVEINKKNFMKKAKGTVYFDLAVITAGIIAQDFLKMDLGTIASIAGLTTAHDIVDSILSSKSTPDEAKQNSYYFLWKISNT